MGQFALFIVGSGLVGAVILGSLVILVIWMTCEDSEDAEAWCGLAMAIYGIIAGIVGVGVGAGAGLSLWATRRIKQGGGPRECPACRGSGSKHGRPGLACNVCGGTGWSEHEEAVRTADEAKRQRIAYIRFGFAGAVVGLILAITTVGVFPQLAWAIYTALGCIVGIVVGRVMSFRR